MTIFSSFENLAFFRGFSLKEPPQTPVLFRTRKDRRPRDLHVDLHQQADEWFKNKFGVPYRSQAVFVTSSRFVAENYAADKGFVARIIPIGNYRFCWSPKNSDLLFLQTSLGNLTVEDYLNGSNYQESDLLLAHQTAHEVMLYCDSYIAIPINLLENPERTEDRTLILL